MALTHAGENFSPVKGSYQHLQGLMLVNLNKIASEIGLNHSEYRLMATLITFWNKIEQKAYPTLSCLSELCSMGKTTILKILKKLAQLNLITIAKLDNKRNCYYFHERLTETKKGSLTKPQIGTPCKTAHDIEQEEQVNKKENIIQKTENDVLSKIYTLNKQLLRLKTTIETVSDSLDESCIITKDNQTQKRGTYGNILQECFSYRC